MELNLNPFNHPSEASRVVRGFHQALVAALVAFPVLVGFVDVSAEKGAAISAGLLLATTTVARIYNVLWPTSTHLDEGPPPVV